MHPVIFIYPSHLILVCRVYIILVYIVDFSDFIKCEFSDYRYITCIF